jgi:hypothetical protein
MATVSQSKYNPSFGSAVQGISIDNNRRLFDFGSRIAELAPQQSPFFVYLSKVAKKATNDPVFKFLEQRHQWQRRDFEVITARSNLNKAAGVALGSSNDLVIKCGYNTTGIIEADQPCKFILPGQTLAVKTNEGVVVLKIKSDTVIGDSAGTDGEIVHGSDRTTIAGEDLFVVGKDMTSTEDMSYSDSTYDSFLEAMRDFFAPESGNSGNKLVLASRKVLTFLNKIGSSGFLNNSVTSSAYRLDVQNIAGQFGHQVTKINTIFGNLHFVAEPLLRGPWEDYCVIVDLANVAYRPLVGNGMSRDTFVETNIQGNDEDGRRDLVLTEAGLEISLPETHAILKFS